MKQILCSGTSREIGYVHGQGAKVEIERGIAFYAGMFLAKSRLDWSQVQAMASCFESVIKAKWPRYYKELQGIAEGAERDLLDIIALNVRSEIVFGAFSDGCTSAYYKGKGYAYIGQNWDWIEDQAANLVQLTIVQEGLPTIQMVTEAGIIGKIGFNSQGVGVCFNAIRAKGVDMDHIPVHLGLRVALECTTAEISAMALETAGLASSAHIMIGDTTTAFGIEFTSSTSARLPLNEQGFVAHSNHMVLEHSGIEEPPWLEDSAIRLEAMKKNISDAGKLSWNEFTDLFKDETNYPCSISRAVEGLSDFATLFNIVVDLNHKTMVVKEGRPV